MPGGKLVHLKNTRPALPWGNWRADSLRGKQFRFPNQKYAELGAELFNYPLDEFRTYQDKLIRLTEIVRNSASDSTEYYLITAKVDGSDKKLVFNSQLSMFYSYFIPVTDIERAKSLWLGKQLWTNASYTSSYLVPFEKVIPIDVFTNSISTSFIGTPTFEFKLKHSDSSISYFSCTLFSFDSSRSNESSFSNVFITQEPSLIWKTENIHLDKIFTLPWEADTMAFISFLDKLSYKYGRISPSLGAYQNPHLALSVEQNTIDSIFFKNLTLFFPYGKFQVATLSIPNENYGGVYKLLLSRYGEPTDSLDNGRSKKWKWLFYEPGKPCRSIVLNRGSLTSNSPDETVLIISDLRSPLQK